VKRRHGRRAVAASLLATFFALIGVSAVAAQAEDPTI
jgi:hypothetical protein